MICVQVNKLSCRKLENNVYLLIGWLELLGFYWELEFYDLFGFLKVKMLIKLLFL